MTPAEFRTQSGDRMKGEEFDNVATVAAMILDENCGGHVLVGPPLVFGGRLTVIVVVGGGDESRNIAIDLDTGDVKDADRRRDELFAEVTRQCVNGVRRGLVVHDCGDERQLIEWAIACYPGPKLEAIRARIIGGGTA